MGAKRAGNASSKGWDPYPPDGAANLGTGRKEVRVGIRNSSGTFRADAFAKVSIPQDPEVFGPGLCGTSILGSMMFASCGVFALNLQMRGRHRASRVPTGSTIELTER